MLYSRFFHRKRQYCKGLFYSSFSGELKLNCINIKAVGDINPGDKAIIGLGVLHQSKKFGPSYPLEKIKDYLKGSDIVIGNLEGLLTSLVEQNRRNNKTFCGRPAFAKALADKGFNILNVANNHTLEHGSEIFWETVNCLKENGIKICGLKSSEKEYYSEPVILKKNNKTIGMIGYNWVGVDNFKEADRLIAQSRDSIVNYDWKRYKKSHEYLSSVVHQKNINVISDIKNLSRKVDFVILIAHWGYEFVHYPPYGLTLEAKSFIDAGADCIIGCHPHVIQGYEIYKSKPIFYSLGNFIFDQNLEISRYSTILDISIDEENTISHRFNPIYINSSFQPQRANENESKKILSIIEKSNSIINCTEHREKMEDNQVYEAYERQYKRIKIKNILMHFISLKDDPLVLILIFKKILNFLNIMQNRIKGKKIRW